jgi:hypothetical protein
LKQLRLRADARSRTDNDATAGIVRVGVAAIPGPATATMSTTATLRARRLSSLCSSFARRHRTSALVRAAVWLVLCSVFTTAEASRPRSFRTSVGDMRLAAWRPPTAADNSVHSGAWSRKMLDHTASQDPLRWVKIVGCQ